ncbi:hypothetical protein GLW05_21005 [Pontibacillus yanchengensis]|uniref:Uncharacterized protein n=1 Tax=Pontibacillus yanchengensis TaxID=462910 RepID=A0A6I5A6V1_9BACI|nr:hypothetical protein [Pontibacillus yanchengensis]MYL36054.1 hypothetical protein [Pontibacillus yanchengensis]
MWLVGSVEELKKVDEQSDEGDTLLLTNDIDLAEVDPIEEVEVNFKGIIKGDGYTIYNWDLEKNINFNATGDLVVEDLTIQIEGFTSKKQVFGGASKVTMRRSKVISNYIRDVGGNVINDEVVMEESLFSYKGPYVSSCLTGTTLKDSYVYLGLSGLENINNSGVLNNAVLNNCNVDVRANMETFKGVLVGGDMDDCDVHLDVDIGLIKNIDNNRQVKYKLLDYVTNSTIKTNLRVRNVVNYSNYPTICSTEESGNYEDITFSVDEYYILDKDSSDDITEDDFIYYYANGYIYDDYTIKTKGTKVFIVGSDRDVGPLDIEDTDIEVQLDVGTEGTMINRSEYTKIGKDLRFSKQDIIERLIWNIEEFISLPYLRFLTKLHGEFSLIQAADIEIFVGEGLGFIQNIITYTVEGTEEFVKGIDKRMEIQTGNGLGFIPLVNPDHVKASNVEMFVDEEGTIKSWMKNKDNLE